jgi:AcrR family transcriptional regulator
MTPRLNPGARRDLIVAAAIPLFARKGFAGTTTREIAEAAGVSEALVFKHFANKTALYDAIVADFQRDYPTFEELRNLTPSTASLLRIVRVTTEYFATLTDVDDVARARYRMYLRSLSEDGLFAGAGVAAFSTEIHTAFTQSFEAARRNGDLSPSAPDAASAFWMVARHNAMLSAWAMLPRQVAADIDLEDSILFLLRGIGVSDAALARYSNAAVTTAVPPRRRPHSDERAAL